MSTSKFDLRIAIIGSGTIGSSFAALHLSNQHKEVQVVIYDPRPDMKDYIEATLPGYLEEGSPSVKSLLSSGRLVIAPSLPSAVTAADIIQEQGPENVAVKQDLWPQIENLASQDALFWSSTSGIPSSIQGKNMRNPSRLLIVHPFNPPHVMPILEIVPPGGSSSSGTDDSSPYITRTVEYWKSLNRNPVVLKQEITGFVANRLSFALFREAIHLVNSGIVTAEEVDRVVEESMGPRWAVKGPFWSYHAGGGKERGLRGFLEKIGDTMQACWDDAGTPSLNRSSSADARASSSAKWEDELCRQVEESYGPLGDHDLNNRDQKTRKVLEITRN